MRVAQPRTDRGIIGTQWHTLKAWNNSDLASSRSESCGDCTHSSSAAAVAASGGSSVSTAASPSAAAECSSCGSALAARSTKPGEAAGAGADALRLGSLGLSVCRTKHSSAE